MIGIGIIGAGGIARSHVQGYLGLGDEDVRIVAVCDTDADRAAALAVDVGAEVYPNYHDLLARADVHIVSVCTPSFTHFQISADALQAGKAVLCEKPLVGSLRELDRLAELEETYGGPLNCVFQYRYGRMFRGLQALVAAGLTGPLITASADVLWFRDATYYAVPWRGKWATELGGALTTLAIHSIDALLALAGPATRLAAETDTLGHTIEVEDVASVTLRFASGAIGNLHVTSCNHRNLSEFRFIFERCTATSHQRPYDPFALPWTFEAQSPAHEAAIGEFLAALDLEDQPEGHGAQIADFVASVRAGHRPPVSIAAIRPTHQVLAAIYKSAQLKATVTLPLSCDDPWYDLPQARMAPARA